MTAASRLAVALIVLMTPLMAEEDDVIAIEEAWIAEPPPGVHVAAAYGVITCECVEGDRLVAVTVTGAALSELHATTSGDDGVVAMRRLDNGVAVSRATPLVFEPGGLHIMIMGLEARPRAGEEMSVRLVFEKAGAVDAVFPVRARSHEGTHQ